MYNVKLSNDAIENLRALVGLNDGRINLKTGIVQVEEKDDVIKLAGKFSVNNVNHQPYDEFVSEATKPAAPASSLEERNKVIGYALEVGSVVRVRTENGTEHAVIIAIDGKQYTAAKLVLSAVKEKPNGPIMVYLKKGEDIVYRNMTYREVVTLFGEIAYGLEWKDFMKGAGGMIVGKVTNLELIQPIIGLINANSEDVPEEEPAPEPENVEATASEDGQNKVINFLKAIEDSETLEELFSKLEVASEILTQAAEECIETGRSNIKKLIPVLQSKYEKAYGRLSQSAIKNKMNEEFKAWCESHDVDMEECSVGYFLKAIAKGLKKS